MEIRGATQGVVDLLREDILAGVLSAGEQLRQDHLAQRYGVSHIPVREALRALQSEGLVQIRPRRGACVAELSIADAQEIGEMRQALECLAVRLAVPRATAVDFDKAERAIAEAQNATASVDRLVVHGWTFHRAICEPCGRQRLLQTLEALWLSADRYVRVIWSELRDRSNHEHAEILELCRARRVAEAEQRLAQHISDGTAQLISILGREPMRAAQFAAAGPGRRKRDKPQDHVAK